MRCFHPWKPAPHMGLPPTLRLPCNQCTGCRLRRSAEWATRCMHETKSHRYNTWVTLTYNDDNLPKKYNTGQLHPRTKKPIYSGTLQKTHVQKFMRKLRKILLRVKTTSNHPEINFEYKNHKLKIIPNLRYYYGGEYGEKYRRPHYHICLFGIDFTDKKHSRTTDGEFKLYTSKTLDTIWKKGTAIIGELNWQTAAYTARYIMKKITGKNNKKHYEVINTDTGEIISLEPEFNDMSRKPGIGNNHYEKYKGDIYKEKTSHVRIKGKKTKPPRYYDKQYKKHAPDHMEQLAKIRLADAKTNWRNHTPRRLQAEEEITLAKIKTLKQKL